MGTLIAIIILGFVGVLLNYYMREDRKPDEILVLGERIKVASWILIVTLVFLAMAIAVLVGTYFGDDQQVKQVMVPVALIVIWFPIFGLFYFSSLSLTLAEKHVERSSIFGKKKILYDLIVKVESLQQGMYVLHLKNKKRIPMEPIFKQSPKIRSYLEDIAYENRSKLRKKARSRDSL